MIRQQRQLLLKTHVRGSCCACITPSLRSSKQQQFEHNHIQSSHSINQWSNSDKIRLYYHNAYKFIDSTTMSDLCSNYLCLRGQTLSPFTVLSPQKYLPYRSYSTTKPTCMRKFKNELDRLYDEEVIKSKYGDETTPDVVDTLRIIQNTKAPTSWFKERLKQEYKDLEPDTNSDDNNDDDNNNNDIDYDRRRRKKSKRKNKRVTLDDVNISASKGLATIENEDIDMELMRNHELKSVFSDIYTTSDYNNNNSNNNTRTVISKTIKTNSSTGNISSGRSYTKTMKTTKSSRDGSFTSITTITTSSSGGDDDDDDDTDISWGSDSDDDDFFDDSDDDDYDSDGVKTIDMPKSASTTIQNNNKKFLSSSLSSPSSSPTRTINSLQSWDDDIPSPKKSSSSWSISLNDISSDIDIPNTLKVPSSLKQNNSSTKNRSNPNNTPGDIVYEWDEATKTMKPMLLIPTTHVSERNNSLNDGNYDMDDVLDTARDEEYNTTPEILDKAKHVDDSPVESEDEEEFNNTMTNINTYYNAARPKYVSRQMENWWDRDDDLVDKSKRKMRLATLRKAQENPLHKKSKTCPYCKKVFKGHAAMVDHLINKNNCSKHLEDTLKEQLTKQRLEMKASSNEKRKRKRERKRNYDEYY